MFGFSNKSPFEVVPPISSLKSSEIKIAEFVPLPFSKVRGGVVPVVDLTSVVPVLVIVVADVLVFLWLVVR